MRGLVTALAVGLAGVGHAEPLPRFRQPESPGEVARPVRLAGEASQALFGRLSPVGDRLAFASDRKGDMDLWLRDLTNGAVEQLTDHPARDEMPAWAPDGERIVFVSLRDDVEGDLFAWTDGDLARLTGRGHGEAFPAYSPEGRYLYFEQRKGGRSRIARLDFEDERDEETDLRPVTPVTDWGFTHPVVSPDGAHLAVTRVLEDGPPRIALIPIRVVDPAGKLAKVQDPLVKLRRAAELAYGEPEDAVEADEPVGFASFSPDAATLYFVRFRPRPPTAPIEADGPSGAWSVALKTIERKDARDAANAARPLTPDDRPHLFLQGHPLGLVVTRGTLEGVYATDLYTADGVVLPAADAAAHLARARSLGAERLRMLALEQLLTYPPGPAVREGVYEAVQLRQARDDQPAARRLAARIAAQAGDDPWSERARCDLMAGSVEAQTEGGRAPEPALVNLTLSELTRLGESMKTPVGTAWCALRRADVLHLGGRTASALAAYREVEARWPNQEEVAAFAHVRRGAALQLIGDPTVSADFLLAAIDRWPAQRNAHREAVRSVLAAVAEGALEGEAAPLRELLERHAHQPLFALPAARRLGGLYARSGRRALAATTMMGMARRHADAALDEAAALAREGAEHARIHAGELRAAGRHAEANRFYDQALAGFRRVVEALPAHHPQHRSAEKAWLQLSLERAWQAEAQGDVQRALKLHRDVLDLRPGALQSLRKRVELELALSAPPAPAKGALPKEIEDWRDAVQGAREDAYLALRDELRERLGADPNDFVARYGLGYLFTWNPNFDEGDLDDAVEQLERAADLDAANPFPAMTLGWAYLVKEQVFGDTGQPWVLKALDQYQRAWQLHERSLDVRTEADLLLSWGNAFSELGNGWKNAWRRYREREALFSEGIDWLDPDREAVFHYRFGRAAFMIDEFAESLKHFELSLAIVRRRMREAPPALAEQHARLETGLIGQMALLDHFVGEYERSSARFERVRKQLLLEGRTEALAAVARAIAHNALLDGDPYRAARQLDEADRLLGQHGAREIEDFQRIAIFPDASLFPLGFGKASEQHIQTGLRERLYRDEHATAHAAELALVSLKQRQRLLSQAESTDLARATWIQRERVAFDALADGDRETFFEEGENIYDAAVRAQSDPERPIEERFQALPEMFSMQASALANRNTQMIRDAGSGRAPEEKALVEQVERILECEAWRQDAEQVKGLDVFPDEEDRLRYLTTSAWVLTLYGQRGLVAAQAEESPSAKDQVTDWFAQAGAVSRAVRLLREALARTEAEPSPALKPPVAVAALPPIDRSRWRVQALLGLADLVSYPRPAAERADDRGRALLDEAATLCAEPGFDAETAPYPTLLDLGHVCWLVRMERATRLGDPLESEKVIGAYLATWPGLLGESYASVAPMVRRRLFGQARVLAWNNDEPERVFELAELEDRKVVADALAAFPHRALAPPLQEKLDDVRIWTEYHQRAVANRNHADPQRRADALEGLQKVADRQLWRALWTAVEARSPAVHQLLVPAPLPWEDLAKALGDEAVLLSAVPVNDRLALYRLRVVDGRVKVEHAEVKGARRIRALVSWGEQTAEEVFAALGPKPAEWLSGQKLVYLDLARLGEGFPVEAFAERFAPGARVVFTVGAHGLVDAWRARNRNVSEGVAAASDALLGATVPPGDVAKALQAVPGWTQPAPDDLTLGRFTAWMQTAGLQLWGVPVRVGADGLANISIGLHDAEVPGLGDYRFAERLGEQLMASLVFIPAAKLGLRRRDAQLMILRYLHAAGVPTVVLAAEGDVSLPAVEWFGQVAGGFRQQRAVNAFYHVPAPVAQRPGGPDDPEGRDALRFDRVRLYGYAGLDPNVSRERAAATLQAKLQQAQQAMDAEQPAEAIPPLRQILTLTRAHPELPSGEQTAVLALGALAESLVAVGLTDQAIRVRREHLRRLKAAAAGGGFAAQQAVGQSWYSLVVTLRGRGAEDEAERFIGWLRGQLAQAKGDEVAEWTEALVQTMELRAAELEAAGRPLDAFAAYREAFAAARDNVARISSLKTPGLLYAAELARLARTAAGDPAAAHEALAWMEATLSEVMPPATGALQDELAALEKQILAEQDPARREALVEQGYGLEQRLVLAELQGEARAAALTEKAARRLDREDPWGALMAAGEALRFAFSDERAQRTVRMVARAMVALGRADEAMSLLSQASQVEPERADDRTRYLVLLGVERARALRAIGRDAEADAVLEEHAGLAGTPALQALVDREWGRALLVRGEVERAAGRYLDAAELARKAGDRQGWLSDQVEAAHAMRLQGAPDEAASWLRRTRAESMQPRSPVALARVDLERARLALARGDRAAAKKAAQEGLKGSGLMPGLRWRLELALARASEGVGREAALRRALKSVERAGARLSRRAPDADTPRDVYDALIALKAAQGDGEGALALSERARARAFLDLVGAVSPARADGAGEALAAALVDWRDALALAESGAAEASDVARAERAVEAARTKLAATHPTQPGYQMVDLAELATLKQRIPAGRALVAWHVLPEALLVFVVDAAGVRMHRVDEPRAALEQRVEAFRERLVNFADVSDDARALWTLLLGPVADALPERVALVPDGPLHALPFAALHDGERAALDRFVLSTLPAVDALRFLAPVGPVKPAKPAAFNWSGLDQSTKPRAGTRRYLRNLERWRLLRKDWPPLPYATRETDSFAEQHPRASVFRGREASAQAFVEQAPAADLLHVATHAIYDPADPMRSYLQFGGLAPRQALPRFEQQRVTPLDVLALDLKAKLVVLSACRTGLVEARRSEGVVGLHRAFLDAGAQSVASSLWRVSDLTTGVLMKNLHRRLGEADPAEALRAAQLRVREHWPHPAHWAGFRLDGL